MKMIGKGSRNLRNEWKEIPQEKINELHQSLTKEVFPQNEPEYPAWFNGKQINEVMFCATFLNQHPMRCVNGILYDVNGQVNRDALRNELYDAVCPYLNSSVAKCIDNLVAAIRISTFTEELPIQTDRIHLNNGTYFIRDRRFSEKKEFCLNRLPVRYNPEAPLALRWLGFLEELLYPEDVPTLQEFMGYCLIPTNRAQRMLMLIGNGGEGKSRIGRVLRALLGDNMNTTVPCQKSIFAKAVGKADLKTRRVFNLAASEAGVQSLC